MVRTDGCVIADKKLGYESSCFECPFKDCKARGRDVVCEDDKVGHGADEFSKDDIRKRIAYEVNKKIKFDGFIHRWMPDGNRLEADYRKGVMERIRLGGTVSCCDCGYELSRSDNIYCRKADLSCKCWCVACCMVEVLAGLYIYKCLGEQVFHQRYYERVWCGRD